MPDNPFFDYPEGIEKDWEFQDQKLIQLQAIRFAKEFSILYKSEKKGRVELEALSEELKAQNEQLMDIIFLTSSQFRKSIQEIESDFTSIREQVDISHKGQGERFDAVEKSLKKLHQSVGEMSKLYRIDSVRSLFRPVSLDKVLAEVLQELGVSFERKNGTAKPLPVLESDRVQLRILFHHLIVLGMGSQGQGEPALLGVEAEKNVGGVWRVTLQFRGSSALQPRFLIETGDEFKCQNRSLDLCQRISRYLGGFLYGEIDSEDLFSCHIVLPEKNIPPASQLKSQTGEF